MQLTLSSVTTAKMSAKTTPDLYHKLAKSTILFHTKTDKNTILIGWNIQRAINIATYWNCIHLITLFLKMSFFYKLESGKLWPSFSSNSCGSPPKELVSSTRNCNVHSGKSFQGILVFFTFAKVSHWLPARRCSSSSLEFQYKYTPYGAV